MCAHGCTSPRECHANTHVNSFVLFEKSPSGAWPVIARRSGVGSRSWYVLNVRRRRLAPIPAVDHGSISQLESSTRGEGDDENCESCENEQLEELPPGTFVSSSSVGRSPRLEPATVEIAIGVLLLVSLLLLALVAILDSRHIVHCMPQNNDDTWMNTYDGRTKSNPWFLFIVLVVLTVFTFPYFLISTGIGLPVSASRFWCLFFSVYLYTVLLTDIDTNRLYTRE